jgi:hypothetical protein
MTPHQELATSSYCLADPGNAYVVYLSTGGAVSAELAAVSGSLTVEWLHPCQATAQLGEPISGGGKRHLEAPFAFDAVLYLHKE